MPMPTTRPGSSQTRSGFERVSRPNLRSASMSISADQQRDMIEASSGCDDHRQQRNAEDGEPAAERALADRDDQDRHPADEVEQGIGRHQDGCRPPERAADARRRLEKRRHAG